MGKKSIVTYTTFLLDENQDLDYAIYLLYDLKYLRTGRKFLIPQDKERLADNLLNGSRMQYKVISKEKVLVK